MTSDNIKVFSGLSTLGSAFLSRRQVVGGLMAAAAWPAVIRAQGTGLALLGAGATLPARMYDKWGLTLSKTTNASLRYAAVGSGQGWTQISQHNVDFAASELPVDAATLAQHGLIQFAVASASIVLTAHLPGLTSNQLRLTPAILGAIYMAQIRYWRHPEIQQINPGVDIPDLAITPVSRIGQSGTTYALTRFLSLTDPAWRARVGITPQAVWDYGLMAKGTSALQSVVARTPGAIGYQVAGRALAQEVSLLSLGYPELGFFNAPARSVSALEWPLATITYAIMPIRPSERLQGHTLALAFFRSGLTSWQPLTRDAGLVPLDIDRRQAVFHAWQMHGLTGNAALGQTNRQESS